MKKRILSLIVAIVMVASLIPAAALSVGAAERVPTGEIGELYYFNDTDNNVTIIYGNGALTATGLVSILLPNVVIEDGVTSIGATAFRGASSIESVTIPASVESIGNYAFQGCVSLESVTYYGSTEPT